MQNNLDEKMTLLPCPFCGAEPDFEKVDAMMDAFRWSIGCSTEGCHGYMSNLTHQRQKDAAESWNRRARPAGALALEPSQVVRSSDLVSRLDWTFDAEQRRWLGRLRVVPEITLFILRLEDDRDDRCTLLGGVMPDEAERRHTRVLVTWAKMAAEWYLDDFAAVLKAANAALCDLRGEKKATK